MEQKEVFKLSQVTCAKQASDNSVTGTGFLGFPKIEIKRKPQRNFQTCFFKIMLEHKGGSTEERQSCDLAQGLALLAAFLTWGQSK